MLAESAAQNPSPPGAAIAGDILYGAAAIALFLFGDRKHRRRVYNLVDGNGLPVFRVGVNICARKSVLLAWIAHDDELIEYRVNGGLHRDDDGPALISRNKQTGAILGEEYYRDGALHREEGPAVLRRDPITGAIVEEEYYQSGARHREDGPSVICRTSDHTVIFEGWYRVGHLHREPSEGPACISHDPALGTIREEYFDEDRIHRDPALGPAVIQRDGQGRVTSEEFWKDGVFLESRERTPPVNRRARRSAKKRTGRKGRRG